MFCIFHKGVGLNNILLIDTIDASTKGDPKRVEMAKRQKHIEGRDMVCAQRSAKRHEDSYRERDIGFGAFLHGACRGFYTLSQDL